MKCCSETLVEVAGRALSLSLREGGGGQASGMLEMLVFLGDGGVGGGGVKR
jgi:hypothetical protein